MSIAWGHVTDSVTKATFVNERAATDGAKFPLITSEMGKRPGTQGKIRRSARQVGVSKGHS